MEAGSRNSGPPSESDLARIVGNVWTSVLGMDVKSGSATATPVETLLTGCLHLSGAWEGAMTLECPMDLARGAAAVMFDREPAAVSEEEIHDGLGELTNMMGGGLKGVLPGPCRQSLPTVATGRDYRFLLPGSRLHARIGLLCGDRPLWISVLTREGKDPPP